MATSLCARRAASAAFHPKLIALTAASQPDLTWFSQHLSILGETGNHLTRPTMFRLPDEPEPAGARHLVVVVRLTLRSDSRLIRGEILDMRARRVGRFVQWSGLTRALRTWLVGQALQFPSSARGDDVGGGE